MTQDLVLYTNPSSRGRIARWMLEETGVPYDTVILEYNTTMKAPEYLAVNPMGKVPALRHRGHVVTEAAAICAYLADAFPEAGLAPPPADPARADYYRWLFFAAGPIEQATAITAAGVEVKPEQTRMFGFGTLANVIDTLDAKLSASPYAAGDRFSAADVYLGAQINWCMHFGILEKRAAFTAYCARLKARPAHVRASQMDDALAPRAQ